MKTHCAWLTHLSKIQDARYTVKVSCYACERRADLSPRDLMAKYGDLPIDALKDRLKCSCGVKRAAVWIDDGR